MDIKRESKIFFWLTLAFLLAYFMPLGNVKFDEAIYAMFDLLRWYAREHVVLCLLPAFLIAGVIAVFVSQASVVKYFGANAKRWVAYSIASVSGTILAVCSCTILPLFSSIYKRGAGLGPAITFLYSGPAINILAIILTARILGIEMGLARVIGAVIFSIVIGVVMSFIYRKEELEKAEEQMNIVPPPEKRPLWQTAFHFFTLVGILVFANWGQPESNTGTWYLIWANKWIITGVFGFMLAFSLIYILKIKWYMVISVAILTVVSGLLSASPLVPVIVGILGVSAISLADKKNEDNPEWIISSWDFTKQIMPLLALGVIIAGFLLGSTHDDVSYAGVIPDDWIASLVGGNSLASNFFASIVGAFMYFATLTEVPILQGLIASGMGKGPALALLLAGPSLSLPNMLVIRDVIGTKKTLVYIVLVVIMATLSGIFYGSMF